MVTIFALLLFIPYAPAQSTGHANDAYEDRNQIDPPSLKISEVKGRAVDPDKVPIPQAQVLLFTGREHILLAKTSTDAAGKFAFHNVRHGTYRLVLKSPGFCPANVPIVVEVWKRRRTVVLHMSDQRYDCNS